MDFTTVSVGWINPSGQWSDIFMARRQDRIEMRSRCWSNSLWISHVLAHLARRGSAPWFQITFSKDVLYQAPLADRDSISFQSK